MSSVCPPANSPLVLLPSHFTDEITEAQEGSMSYSRSRRLAGAQLGSRLKQPALQLHTSKGTGCQLPRVGSGRDTGRGVAVFNDASPVLPTPEVSSAPELPVEPGRSSTGPAHRGSSVPWGPATHISPTSGSLLSKELGWVTPPPLPSTQEEPLISYLPGCHWPGTMALKHHLTP